MDEIYTKYDDNLDRVPHSASDELMNDMSKQRPAGRRLVPWIYDTCDEDPEDPDGFPTTPGDVP